MKVVYFFGDEYYQKSGTMMGSLYTESGKRYDWGFLQRDVRNGEDVVVKPATREMLAWADNQLRNFQIKQNVY